MTSIARKAKTHELRSVNMNQNGNYERRASARGAGERKRKSECGGGSTELGRPMRTAAEALPTGELDVTTILGD